MYFLSQPWQILHFSIFSLGPSFFFSVVSLLAFRLHGDSVLKWPGRPQSQPGLVPELSCRRGYRSVPPTGLEKVLPGCWVITWQPLLTWVLGSFSLFLESFLSCNLFVFQFLKSKLLHLLSAYCDLWPLTFSLLFWQDKSVCQSLSGRKNQLNQLKKAQNIISSVSFSTCNSHNSTLEGSSLFCTNHKVPNEPNLRSIIKLKGLTMNQNTFLTLQNCHNFSNKSVLSDLIK